MRRGTKMLLMSANRKNNRNRERDRIDWERNNVRDNYNEGSDMRNRYNYGMENNYRDYGMNNNYESDMRYRHEPYYNYDGDMESRFRDRRGREHYDNGRYAPKNAYDSYDGEVESRRRRSSRTGRFIRGEYEDEPYSRYDVDEYEPEMNYGRYEMNDRRIPYKNPERPNRIGFDISGRMQENKSKEFDSDYNQDEMKHRKGKSEMGMASSHQMPKFDKEMAEEWVGHMQNEDGTKGEHWSIEQAKKIMDQNNINCDPYEFYAAINAMYSDFYKICKKHGVSNIAFYADLAKAFIDDPDAVDDKLAAYYFYVVKHE